MASNLRKFVNERFLKTIDLGLMKEFLGRHSDQLTDFDLSILDGEDEPARKALHDLLSGSEDRYPEGVREELHLIADLGTARGLEVILRFATSMKIDLFPEVDREDKNGPNEAHEPKHLALRVFLEHRDLFNVASDQMVLMSRDRLYPYRSKEAGVVVDVTPTKVEEFRQCLLTLFKEAFLGDYCRVGSYVDGDEINFVISHGTTVSTMPVAEGQEQRVIAFRAIQQAVLRYSEATGILGIGRVIKQHRPAVAEIFANTILGKPGLFANEDAQELYSLSRVEKAGTTFAFSHAYDEAIERVRIIEAAADLMVPGKKAGQMFVARSLRSRDLSGAALRHFATTPVRFDQGWRLSELMFRVFFRSEKKPQPQVTVRLRPPAVLEFRRSRYEGHIMDLIQRNGLFNERSAVETADAAE